MRLALFEDGHAADFFPVALTRPVFELLCGHFSVRERWLRQLPVTDWGVFARSYLGDVYREGHPDARINDVSWLATGPTLVVNGRWLPDSHAIHHLRDFRGDECGYIGDTPVWFTLEPEEALLLVTEDWGEQFERRARTRRRVQTTGHLLAHPWDLIEQNPRQLAYDFAARNLGGRFPEPNPQFAVLGPPEQIHIEPSAQIDPFVVIDARRGPVSIEGGAWIQPFTRVEGPCHIGEGSQLFRTHLRGGTTLGPQCRVGGEIEACILQGFVNKYHDGFLGHSYLGSWVNLGAQTTNSDLKHDYSSVRVPLSGTAIDTGLTKVGSFIGDHTKTALNSLLNTGTSVGVMCMILPGGELLPKHIPSFTSIWHGELAEGLPLERCLEGARAALRRRERELTPAHERLLRHLHYLTRAEREEALAHFQEKRQQTVLGL